MEANNRDAHWFTVTLGHSCHWCHRWVKIGERAHYQSHGDCGIVYCQPCAKKAGWQDVDETASWVIVDKATNKAVAETFNKRVVDGINRAKYAVVDIQTYLGNLNATIKAA